MIGKVTPYSHNVSVEALRAIKMIGDINEMNGCAEKALESEGHMSEVIGILNSVPDIDWTDGMIKSILRGLVGDYELKVAEAVKQVPELLENPAIRHMLP